MKVTYPFFSALFIVLSIYSLSGFSTASAQTGSISGTVFTDDTKESVPFATIQIAGTSIGLAADINGVFTIPNVPIGEQTITIRSVGYQTYEQVVEVIANRDTELQIILRADNLNLNEVVVSGTRYAYDRANSPVVVNLIDNKLLNATQSIAISEGLNYQPGVRVETNCQNCGFTQVRMNGLEGAYSQILINSRPIFSALNSVYGLDQIPTNIVEKIEVVRSGGSALYGSNAIAGTINIITREPVENNWEASSNTASVDGVLDQTYNFSGSIVNESLTNGVTFYGMNRNRDSYDANDDGFTELVQLENTVLGLKTFLKPNEQSKISLDFSALNEYRRGGDRLDLAPHFTDITEELTHNTFFGSLNYELWSKDDRNKVLMYASTQNTDRDSFYGGLGGGRTAEDSLLAINAYGLTEDLSVVTGFQYNHYLTNDDVLTLGVENQYYDTRDEIQGYNRLIDQQVNTTGFFAQYEWKPVERFTALLGARYDLSNVDGNYQVGNVSSTADINIGVLSPRATLLYKINDDLRFRGGYARGFRAPQAFNEDLHISSVGGEPLFVILSEDLDKETSDAFTGSLNYTSTVGLAQISFLLEGFHTLLRDPFTQVSAGAVLPNGSILEEVRNGEGATVTGINVEAGYSPSSKLSFTLGGTAQQTSYDEPQVLFEPEGVPAPGEGVVSVDEFVRNPDLYGYFTTFYDVSNSLRFDITGTYTGTMIVPRVVSDSGFLDLFESDPFLDMNIKASYSFEVSDDLDITFSGGAKNIFNSFQPEFESGPQRDSDFIYGPMAPRSIFFSIKLGKLN
ncbi:MAG: TonB-dependent receptor [Bacteroidota bacterium]